MFLRLLPLLKILIFKKKLSLRKIYTFSINFLVGYILRKDKLYAYPSLVMIEPTNLCNLHCSGCGFQIKGGRSSSAPRSYMSFDFYKRIIDEIKNDCLFLFLYMGGEPFLNKQMFEMIQYASSNKIFTILATNGSFQHIRDFGKKINESGLDLLVFSVSGTTQFYYEKFHQGGLLEDVMKNITSIIEERKDITPRILLRYLATLENKGDWKNVKTFAEDLGVDSYEMRNIDGDLVLSGNFLNELPEMKSKSILKGRHCFWLWSAMVVRVGGDVIPCCFDYYGVPVLGTINKDSTVRDIWHGVKYRNFRKAWIDKKMLDCCACCESRLGFQDGASEGKNKIFVKAAGVENKKKTEEPALQTKEGETLQ